MSGAGDHIPSSSQSFTRPNGGPGAPTFRSKAQSMGAAFAARVHSTSPKQLLLAWLRTSRWPNCFKLRQVVAKLKARTLPVWRQPTKSNFKLLNSIIVHFSPFVKYYKTKATSTREMAKTNNLRKHKSTSADVFKAA